MRSHLERYEFPNPFSMQEKICMTYSYLSLCYGLAFPFLSFIFCGKHEVAWDQSLSPFFLNCAFRHEHWIWYSHLPLLKRMDPLSIQLTFKILSKRPKEISIVWVHIKKTCQPFLLYGFVPLAISHPALKERDTAFVFWLAKQANNW